MGRRGQVQQVAGHYLSVPLEHWWPWLVGSDSNSVGVKYGGLQQTVLALVQSSFVEVGWQKQEKGAVQDRRRPVSIQGMGQGLGQKWVPL